MPTFDSSSFVTTYFPIPFFLVLVIGYQVVKKPGMVTFGEMDFHTGSSEDIVNEPSAKGVWGKLKEYV